jgi:hypothetical protein
MLTIVASKTTITCAVLSNANTAHRFGEPRCEALLPTSEHAFERRAQARAVVLQRIVQGDADVGLFSLGCDLRLRMPAIV